jgi:hypothetical protein
MQLAGHRRLRALVAELEALTLAIADGSHHGRRRTPSAALKKQTTA